MTENVLRIHLTDSEPNIAEMYEILLQKGFRQLTDANQENLPSGTVALLYTKKTNTIIPIVVINHFHLGFSYMVFNDLSNNADMYFMNRAYDFEDMFYLKLFQAPMVDFQPQLESLPQVIAEAGFSSLDNASPDDLPEGCIALIYSEPAFMLPVIVRVLSLSNKRLLYLHEGIVAGKWENEVIMDNLRPFRNYSYLVIS